MNATATACVFKFFRTNPKIIMRWPCHVKTDDQPRLNGKLRACLGTRGPANGIVCNTS